MSECPFCGEKIKNEQSGCKNCGYGAAKAHTQNEPIDGMGRETESRTIYEEPRPNPAGSSTPPKGYDWNNDDLPKFVRILFYVLILYSPILGFISGIFFLFVQNGKHRRFGVRLLIATVLIYIIFLIIRGLFFSVSFWTMMRSF